MQININDDLMNKLKEQADDKDLSKIVADAIEFFLTCSEAEATSAEHLKKPFKMIKGGAYDGLYDSLVKHGLWDVK